MSRGFVKEDDQEEVPIVPPRAYLPDGVVNYVTPEGLEQLNKEHVSLTNKRTQLTEQPFKDNRVEINFLTAKLNLLEERINSAQLVEINENDSDEVLFGAHVTLFRKNDKKTLHYKIVGVDEANISENKVSFLSPMAKVLFNKRLGDVVSLKTPKGEITVEIKSIEY